MRTKSVFAALGALALTVSALASGPSLTLGSPAPAMDVKTWIKGTPVTEFDPAKLYVVEFWATWCGPCKESIPHLTELAKKNTDVTFVGVSIWEDQEGDNIKNFVDKMGDKMDYNVGYSGNKEGMATTWMQAAGQDGIPTAFVIKDSKIAWIGHPMELEEPLTEIKKGTFDAKAYAAEYAKKVAAGESRMSASKAIQAAVKLHEAGKKAEAKAAMDAAAKKYPAMADQIATLRYMWTADDNPTAWMAQTKKLIASGKQDDMMQVADFALEQSQTKKHMDLAKKAMAMVNAANAKKNYFLIYYYQQMFYMQIQDYKTAAIYNNKLTTLFPKSEFKDNENLKADLAEQKKIIAAKLAG